MGNRGYAGYYRDIYLRSSYEYAYAIYLDYFEIEWRYEVMVLDIGYKLYKPDFFLINPDRTIKKIIEVKSRNLQAIKNAEKDLQVVEDKFGYEWEIVSYKELMYLYKELPFSLNSVITKWINSDKTTINKAAFGNKNGHFNMKHSDETKIRIGKHTKKLWQTDSPSRRSMIEGLKKSGIKKGYIRVHRETRTCILCKSSFITLATSTKQYCSRKCSGKVAIKSATESYVSKRSALHEEVKKLVIAWSVNNKEILLNAPYNRVKTTIAPLIHEIEMNYGIKDFRVISKAVFGKDCGRKELLRFMKKVCNENVC
ncbi:restriction endonuclease [Solibacillus sp. FSL K6-1523]|uniref:restriction endonuclease n=1 Tax=Solibacillus sp. FSL K6-1523 TaxID=2921471 RepID=UPI0030FC08E3